jgi:hypothetical protein
VFCCFTGYVVLLARRCYRGNCGFNKIEIETKHLVTMAEVKVKLEAGGAGYQETARKVAMARERATALPRVRVVLQQPCLKENARVC